MEQLDDPASSPQPYIEASREDSHVVSAEVKHRSVMRGFLESGAEFNWPPEVGSMKDNNCHIHRHVNRVPLIHKRNISSKKAIIDEFNIDPVYPYRFTLPFIVKEARSDKGGTHREEAAKEINNMRDLRHPHIAALLGTYEYQARLCILIFPVASCDLDQFMRSISVDIRGDPLPAQEYGRILCRWDSTSSSAASVSAAGDLASQQGDRSSQGGKLDYWPLDVPLAEKKAYLRRYFVCLSGALKYLHESGVRHKDVKPANILIDRSGSAILTDFGISKRFTKNESHVTSTERAFTKKYGSPEMMNSRPTPRGDQSDVFSLGCVFLEMATLLFHHDHTLLQKHCSHIVNDTAVEDAYHLNLPKAYSWLDHMKSSQSTQIGNIGTLLESSSESFDESGDSGESTRALITSLPNIRKMLDEDPPKRPKSDELCVLFQSISSEQCEDCDPRRPNDIWKPSTQQRENLATGRQRRDARSNEKQPVSELRLRRSSLAPEESQETQQHKRRRPRSYPPAISPKTVIVPEVPAITHRHELFGYSRPSTPKAEDRKQWKEGTQSPHRPVLNTLENQIPDIKENVTEDELRATDDRDTKTKDVTIDESKINDLHTDESSTYDSAPDENGGTFIGESLSFQMSKPD
ncbi:uncharacterized protein KY384_005207 [Bacidia gigantensis]|uniref:uncharacterized protein n=1 Tax=Bacidia gigantensis TaxID=2732470 RepID=UPI001D05BB55|nr:uncharacterized protein KY384_005207 [Bacidia gigantensis]KAG8529726.1 hypothetical protein KY384_005207 [Bacidia gigantensis]